MVSAPGIDFLPLDEQPLFAREFQKDTEFLQLLILMISKACVTGSVDITWVDAHDGLRQVLGTTQAAKSACSRYLNWERQDPSQRFCNIVSDYGRRAAESCAVCENAAEKRVGKSGRAQVYRCHAGLTDIAVPVIADGRHIATLYSGQVLTAPPSPEGFERVSKDVRRLTYIDLKELGQAYMDVPVVSEEEIQNTVRILEVFAEFLARFWTRVGETVRGERRRVRTSQLAAKEFAYLLLEPSVEDRARLCQLMRELGFVEPPNRVIVAELEEEAEIESATALHAIEELAEKTKNMSVAYLRRRGVCVFFRDLTEGRSAGLRARSLAEKILYEISERCNVRVRVGIGGLKPHWRQLAESYHEACLALASSQERIAVCGDGPPGLAELTAQTEAACGHLAAHRIREARVALRALPMLASRRLGESAWTDHRNFFSAALETICLTALKAGCDAGSIARVRTEAQREFGRAATTFDMHTVFLEAADLAAAEIDRLLSGKYEKVVARVQQMIDRRLQQGRREDAVSLAAAARALGVSTGHLSRVFRRTMGMTFRDYVISRRIEQARRLLLDPLQNVSMVAERCGFSSPAYFARAFRKAMGCAPTEYAGNPRRYGACARAASPDQPAA